MRKAILIVLLIAALPVVFAHPFNSTPLTFWNTVCSNQWQDVANLSISLAVANVTPTTSNGASTASSSTPSTVANPTVAFGSTNCQSSVSRQIRWENQVTGTGASDKIIVNTPQETVAIANQDNDDISVVEIRWYDQEGLLPSNLTATELRVDHVSSILDVAHAAVSDGPNRGDMMLATIDGNNDLSVGRYRANTTPTVCQISFSDNLSTINFVDYNNGMFAILAEHTGGNDVVVYTITSNCALNNRVAIDGGISLETGHGIRLDSAGDVYLSFTAGFPGTYHVLKLSNSTISWDKILTASNVNELAEDNLVALVGSNVYAGGNHLVGGGQIFRLSQAAGTADFQLNLGTAFFLNGIVPASILHTGLYYYGRNDTALMGASGIIKETAGIPANLCVARHPEFSGGVVNGFAEGNFFHNYIVGRTGASSGTHGANSVGQLVRSPDCLVFTGTFNGFLTGTETDIGNLFGFDEYYDVVRRPSAGFFDFFTVVGNAITTVEQMSTAHPCGDGAIDTPFEECDTGLADGHQEGAGVACPVGQNCLNCKCVTIQLCGNGQQDLGEECDDGNLIPGDGCEPDCTLSPGC